jgi:hypothetical protein
MGLQYGTPQFAQCRMTLLQQHEANAAQARQNRRQYGERLSRRCDE